MGLKLYSKGEPLIFLWFILPFVIALNAIIFGNCIFASLQTFGSTFLVSVGVLVTSFLGFRSVAFLIRNRFPSNADLFRRIAVMLGIFAFMNILLITGLYAIHNAVAISGCPLVFSNFWWAFLFATLSSTIITILNEAMVNWNSWKRSITETEELKNAYQKTRLLGLKGQVNPHFLFNCFNSLSSLISEDEEAAEQFLNEMTKVHRYMLRGDDELLVTLEEEIRFVKSYLFLIQYRFGEAVKSSIRIPADAMNWHLPPLSLQVIMENVIYTNSASTTSPLQIEISLTKDHLLDISNTVSPRMSRDIYDHEEGLDNLLNKYRLLDNRLIQITETESERHIYLPLLKNKEVVL